MPARGDPATLVGFLPPGSTLGRHQQHLGNKATEESMLSLSGPCFSVLQTAVIKPVECSGVLLSSERQGTAEAHNRGKPKCTVKKTGKAAWGHL